MSEKYLNTLIVSGTKLEREKFKRAVDFGEDDKCLSLRKSLPIPKKIADSDIRVWCVKNWGTPCDADVEDLEETDAELIYHFFSVYAPPICWLETVSQEFSNLIFIMKYQDEYEDYSQISVVVKRGKVKRLK